MPCSLRRFTVLLLPILCGNLVFAQPRLKPTPPHPFLFRHDLKVLKAIRQFAVGDFNGDGILDIIATTDGSSKLLVFYGIGTGDNADFAPAKEIELRGEPADIKACTFTQSRSSDLAVVFRGEAKVKIFHVTPSGSFSLAAEVATQPNPDHVFFADLNGDGRTDLVVTSKFSNGLQVFYRGEKNKFYPPEILFQDGSFGSVAFDSFSEESSQLDFVLGDDLKGELQLIHNETLSALREPVRLSFGSPIGWIATANLNQNSLPDVVLSLPEKNQVVVIFDYGTQTYTQPIVLDCGIRPTKVIVRDVNGDDLPDILVLDEDERSISVFLAKGDNTFHDRVVIGTGGKATDFDVRDINGDRKIELIFADRQNKTISIITSKEKSLLGRSDVISYASGSSPMSLAMLASPSGTCLFAACEKSKSISAFTFAKNRTSVETLHVANEPRRVFAVRKDHTAFLIVQSQHQSSVAVSRFQEMPSVARRLAKEAEANLIATDISYAALWQNHDSRTSLQLLLYDEGDVELQPQLLLYDISLSGEKPTLTPLTQESSFAATTINMVQLLDDPFHFGYAALAYDAAQECELIDVRSQKKPLFVVQNLLASRTKSPADTQAIAGRSRLRTRAFVTGDFDGDGKPDFLLSDDKSISVLLSQNDYKSKIVETIDAFSTSDIARVLDVNGDGKLDVVIANQLKGKITLWLGNGDGTFKPPIDLLTETDASDFIIFRNGSETKLAVANPRTDTVDLLTLKFK
jgi:hypothetical protein